MKRVIVCGLLTLLFAAACLLLRLGAARTQTVRTQYPAVAQRIVDYRAAQGGFSDPRELLNVTGIGEATLGRLLEYVTVEGQYENSGRGR